MINAAIIGLGLWGKTLVEALAEPSNDLRFVALTTPTISPEVTMFAHQYALRVVRNYQEVLADSEIDAVVLATPPSGHVEQVIAAAAAGKHVFCEKPFSYSKQDAIRAVEAVRGAKRVLGIGYNRRFHPEMRNLRERIRSGDLGIIHHVECTMTFPNRLFVTPTGWRALKSEMPCGGLAPMGVHAVDAMIDLCGEIDSVYCQSFARVLEGEIDDTTAMLFRMKEGISGYLGTITTTAPAYSIQVFGSRGWLRIEGMTHVAGASSEERRAALFGSGKFQPIKGPLQIWQAENYDVTRACLEAFARAADGGSAFPIAPDQIIHGAAVCEAIIRSAASGSAQAVP
jgi:predicted dehydrogenase